MGTTNYEPTANSDVVIVTAGVARKPGMSRDDLISINTGIVKSVAENVAKHSPKAVMIVVSDTSCISNLLTVGHADLLSNCLVRSLSRPPWNWSCGDSIPQSRAF